MANIFEIYNKRAYDISRMKVKGMYIDPFEYGLFGVNPLPFYSINMIMRSHPFKENTNSKTLKNMIDKKVIFTIGKKKKFFIMHNLYIDSIDQKRSKLIIHCFAQDLIEIKNNKKIVVNTIL